MAGTAIIGAGMAGLACAHALNARGVDWTLFESSDDVGGRVRTDLVEGFRLDRGFQVYLTAYRAAGELIDDRALDFRAFRAGAMVFDGRGFVPVLHPLRHPIATLRGLAAAPAMALDLARLAPMALDAVRHPVVAPGAPEGSTEDLLRRMDIGRATVDGFLRSFFGGVFLDRSLGTDASQFRFTFSAFARGQTVLPARGMGEIPRQVAAALPAARIRLRSPVASLAYRRGGYAIRGTDGKPLEFDSVVVATDMSAAHRLDGRIEDRTWCETVTFHWACRRSALPAPLLEPVLFLDGTGDGPINHAACTSSVAPGYAPAGEALVALSAVGIDWTSESMASVLARTVTQLERWFGRDAMRGWRLLRTDRIVRALPRQHTADLAARPDPEVDEGLFVAGDHVTDGSIDGAVRSGLRAAEAVLRRVSR